MWPSSSSRTSSPAPSSVIFTRSPGVEDTSTPVRDSWVDSVFNKRMHKAVARAMNDLTTFVEQNSWLGQDQITRFRSMRLEYLEVVAAYRSLNNATQFTKVISYNRSISRVLQQLKRLMVEYYEFKTIHFLNQGSAQIQGRRFLRGMAEELRQVDPDFKNQSDTVSWDSLSKLDCVSEISSLAPWSMTDSEECLDTSTTLRKSVLINNASAFNTRYEPTPRHSGEGPGDDSSGNGVLAQDDPRIDNTNSQVSGSIPDSNDPLTWGAELIEPLYSACIESATTMENSTPQSCPVTGDVETFIGIQTAHRVLGSLVRTCTYPSGIGGPICND